jgi:hypothetical protein
LYHCQTRVVLTRMSMSHESGLHSRYGGHNPPIRLGIGLQINYY